VINESGSVWGGTARLVEEASIGVEAGNERYMLGNVLSISGEPLATWNLGGMRAVGRAALNSDRLIAARETRRLPRNAAGCRSIVAQVRLCQRAGEALQRPSRFGIGCNR
jgi:hypothetical protein